MCHWPILRKRANKNANYYWTRKNVQFFKHFSTSKRFKGDCWELAQWVISKLNFHLQNQIQHLPSGPPLNLCKIEFLQIGAEILTWITAKCRFKLFIVMKLDIGAKITPGYGPELNWYFAFIGVYVDAPKRSENRGGQFSCGKKISSIWKARKLLKLFHDKTQLFAYVLRVT